MQVKHPYILHISDTTVNSIQLNRSEQNTLVTLSHNFFNCGMKYKIKLTPHDFFATVILICSIPIFLS